MKKVNCLLGLCLCLLAFTLSTHAQNYALADSNLDEAVAETVVNVPLRIVVELPQSKEVSAPVPQNSRNQETGYHRIQNAGTKLAYFQEPIDPGDNTVATDEDTGGGLWNILKEYWAELLLGLFAFIEVIVTITPTEKDNTWLRWLKNIVQGIIPNKKKGGGVHPT